MQMHALQRARQTHIKLPTAVTSEEWHGMGGGVVEGGLFCILGNF